MWNKITSKLNSRVISKAITKTIVETTIDSLIDDSGDSIIDFLSQITPDELLSYATENKSIADSDSKDEWVKRFRKIVVTARRTRQLDFEREQDIVKKIQEYDSSAVIPLLREKAIDRSVYGDDVALQNFGFLINSFVCKQWLIDNIEQVKKIVIEEIVRK